MKRIIPFLALFSCVLLKSCAQTSTSENDIDHNYATEEQIGSSELHIFDKDIVESVLNPDSTDRFFLNIDAGKIMFFEKEDKESESYVAAMNVETYYDMQTKERYREHFKFHEIDGITSEDAMKMAQEIVDRLDIPNLEEPQIFTCPGHTYAFDEDDIIDIKDSYFILYLAGENKPYYDGKRGYAEFIICANGLVSFSANYICD